MTEWGPAANSPAMPELPEVETTVRGLARVLEGDEREQWYERGIEIYPGWVQYRKRAPRQIPVIELSAPS